LNGDDTADLAPAVASFGSVLVARNVLTAEVCTMQELQLVRAQTRASTASFKRIA
jgi:hypothetical protein